MALLLSAVGFLPAQNLVDVPLDGLQLLEPLFLFVVGVIKNDLRSVAGSMYFPCEREKDRSSAEAL